LDKSPVRWEEVWKHFGTDLDSRTVIHAWLSSGALIDATSKGYRAIWSVDGQYYLDALGEVWQSFYSALCSVQRAQHTRAACAPLNRTPPHTLHAHICCSLFFFPPHAQMWTSWLALPTPLPSPWCWAGRLRCVRGAHGQLLLRAKPHMHCQPSHLPTPPSPPLPTPPHTRSRTPWAAGGETADGSDVLQTIWPRAAAAAERQWSYDVTGRADAGVAYRLQAFRCWMLERGIAAAPVTNPSARSAPAGPGSCMSQ